MSSFPKARTEIDPLRIARPMGWLGMALGAAKLGIPGLIGRAIGVGPGSTPVMRALGARDLATAAMMLLRPGRPAPLWSRVAADLVDLGLLGLAMRSPRASSTRIAGAMAAVLGMTALDVLAAEKTRRARKRDNEPVIASVTINRPPLEVYRFFRRLEQLPQFMDYLESVEEIGPTRSRWTAKLPVGGTASWTAFLVEDTPGEAIAWETDDDSAVQTRGRVTFTKTPGRDMTEVRIELALGFTVAPPTIALAKLFARPQVKGDLRRLKQVLETGEVLVSDASAHRAPHPAQPPAEPAEVPRMFLEHPPTAVKAVTP